MHVCLRQVDRPVSGYCMSEPGGVGCGGAARGVPLQIRLRGLLCAGLGLPGSAGGRGRSPWQHSAPQSHYQLRPCCSPQGRTLQRARTYGLM